MGKKLGELTLREFAEIINRPCLSATCRECKEKHSADYVICRANFEYDPRVESLLDEEIEVEENE